MNSSVLEGINMDPITPDEDTRLERRNVGGHEQ